ncbi:MAG: prepilin-type N-terminal cleavage/methylation domain-containing protein [Myxococcales bacterium]|nr:MAG: prepilin-type N-terminal cleavage/methylation domain-containing protein [Myxococcales bacterium]
MPTQQITAAERGFTLLELLIVAVILAVGAGVLFATMGARPARTYTNSASNEVYSLLQNARAEAMQSGRNVIVQGAGSQIQAVRDEDNNNQANECADTSLQHLCRLVNLNKNVVLKQAFGPVVYNNRGLLVTVSGSSQPTNPLNQVQASVSIMLCTPKPAGGGCEAGQAFSRVTANYVGLPAVDYGEYTE